jgi:sugar phosphate isomerase/epimerase
MPSDSDYLTRRQLMLAGAGSILATGLAPVKAAPAGSGAAARPALCLFSKHLQQLDHAALATTLRELGFSGVDLTVRPGGHVLPENVERDLPKAVAALGKENITVSMITTGLTSASDPTARPTLLAAAKNGIPFFKVGYYRYSDAKPFDETLAEVKREVEGLAKLAADAKIQGGLHNHNGNYVGAAMWDNWWVLRDVDPNVMGVYFDPCHATAEGGNKGWEIGFHRLAGRIKMVAIKDFYWEKSGGEWRVHMCPLGEGMVDFPRFFKLLAASGFHGPISLHLEYKIDGPTESAREERTLAAIERDLGYLKLQVSAAFG